MDPVVNLTTYVSTEAPERPRPIRHNRSSTTCIDLSLSETEFKTLYSKDSQELKPWTSSNPKLKALLKEMPRPVIKERPPKAQKMASLIVGKRSTKERRKTMHRSISKLAGEDTASKDAQSIDLSIDVGRPRAQTDITAVLAAEKRKSPEIVESKGGLNTITIGKNDSEKVATQLSRQFLTNSSLVKKINLSRKRDVEKTFDDGNLLEASYIETAANMSYDVLDQPNRLPFIGVHNILEDLGAKKQAFEIDKKYIPQMFLREEPEEKPKVKAKLKSDLTCWRQNRRPSKPSTTVKTEEGKEPVYGYLRVPRQQKNLLNLLVCPQKPQPKTNSSNQTDEHKNFTDFKRHSELSYMNSSLRTRIEGEISRRKNSPFVWDASGRREKCSNEFEFWKKKCQAAFI